MHLQRQDLFSIPIWKTSVPALREHHDELRRFFLDMWEQGEFRKHQFGYGYQTPSVLYDQQSLEKLPALKILRQAFATAVSNILAERVNHSVHLPPEIYADMAWALIQTNEDWVNGSWHDHAPALISGCYYLQQPETDGDAEGALAFQRPGSVDPFVQQVQFVKPAEGDFILFPSYLQHRPTPCPSADGLRISINMDAYVHWIHWDEKGKPKIHPERYKKLLDDSLA